MAKRSFVFFITCALFMFNGCFMTSSPFPPTQQDLARQFKVRQKAIRFPLPERFFNSFALTMDHHAVVEKVSGSKFLYRVWTPEMIHENILTFLTLDGCEQVTSAAALFEKYKPHLLDLCNSVWANGAVGGPGEIGDIGADPHLIRPVQIPGSVNIEQTLNLQAKLQKDISNFYKDLNRTESRHYDQYNNEYLWSPSSYSVNQKWKKFLDKENHYEILGRVDFLKLASNLIRGDYVEEFDTETKVLPKPNIEVKQSEFESTRHFLYRLQGAKTRFVAYQQEFQSREVEAVKVVEKREKLLVYRAFVLYFGEPEIAEVHYDPDTRLFAFRIKGTRGGSFRFISADRIMNDQAPEYKQELEKASPKILLRVSERKLLLDGGYLELQNGSSLRILPLRTEFYQTKNVALGSFPRIRVPEVLSPETIAPNSRMKREGEKIVRDTVYFQGLQ
ncbi:MAG: hypothetical protein ACYDBP_06660 [Leptospirales bacterium]